MSLLNKIKGVNLKLHIPHIVCRGMSSINDIYTVFLSVIILIIRQLCGVLHAGEWKPVDSYNSSVEQNGFCHVDVRMSMIQPHLKKLVGTPFWEIRILGRDNIRVLYVARSGNSIMVLHAFMKKTQKTPQREISTALKRLQEFTSCL
jgi:hypothetical protein